MTTTQTNDRNTFVPAGMPEQEFKMQVRVSGEGPPIVLVGGGLTGWKSWDSHTEQLSATRTVVRVQPLSVQYGLENRPLPDGYSVRTECAALAAALDDLDLEEPFDLLGWSYGGLISLDFALAHPEHVRTLTLIEPPATWVLPDRGMDDPDVKSIYVLETDDDVSEDDLEQFLRAASVIPPKTDPRELPQWPLWIKHRRALRAIRAPLDHHDDPKRLEVFDRPVMLVTGTGTAPYYCRIRDMLAARLPHTRSIEMPSGHVPHIVSMDRFLAELARFHELAGSTGQ